MQRIGGGCLLVFAVPFVVIGVGIMFVDTPDDRSLLGQYVPYLFGGVFSLAGGALATMGVWVISKARRLERRVAAAPSAPWRWRDDWVAGQSEDLLQRKMTGVWLFALLWTAVSSIPLAFAHRAAAGGQPMAALALIFPGIGVAMLLYALYLTLRRVKFGRSVMTLARVPFVPGGSVTATVRARMRDLPDEGLSATLRHVHRITTGSGRSRSVREEVQWELASRIPRGSIAPSSDALRIPIHFRIPEDACETNVTSNENYQHIWRVDLTAEVPGVDYAARFELPVFRLPTAESEDTHAG
jgi:hypothetical protein